MPQQEGAEGRCAPVLPYTGDRLISDPAGCFFYHTMELPGFGLQDGCWDLRGRFEDYVGHVDLRGRRLLDVGAASGFLSFEAERRGADVTSFDLDTAERQTLLPFRDSEYVRDRPSWQQKQTESLKTWQRAYWLAHRLYGSKARAVYGDVYRLPRHIGPFDVVLLGAILEHLIDPLSALREAAALTRDLLVVNTTYFETPMPMAAFNGRADRPDNSFIFWTYSIALYDEYMAIMGFDPVVAHKDSFAATRPSAGAARPMLDRVALVYKRAG